jgi:hypothetical protein
MHRVVVFFFVAVVLAAGTGHAQQRRVTVATTSGDVIEGTLKSANDSEIVIQSALRSALGTTWRKRQMVGKRLR